MIIETIGSFMIARLQDSRLSETERETLTSMANEELVDELADMLDEAEALADPKVLFGVCAVTDASPDSVTVNGICVKNALVAEQLGEKKRCFPYICTCGTALAQWSEQYKDDMLASVWAEEIQKTYLHRVSRSFFQYITDTYHMSGYRASLNPGSRREWSISGQKALFDILGGPAFVREQIGVVYTDSYLMLPIKSTSGISFESKTAYENCQYCPLENCPNRRAVWIR